MARVGSLENLAQAIVDIKRAIYDLTFTTNFTTFTWTGDIPAGGEQWISNPLAVAPGVVPTSFIVLDGMGTRDISRSNTPWTINTLYVKNNTTTNATGLVIRFFK